MTALPVDRSGVLIRSEMTLCVAMGLLVIAQRTSAVSVCLGLSYILLFVGFIDTLVRYRYNGKEYMTLILLLMITLGAFLSVFVDLLLSASVAVEPGYFKKCIIFCSTVVFLFISSKVEVSKRTVDFVLRASVLLACAFVLCYFFGNRSYYAGSWTSNFSNPNLAGLWLLHTILYLFVLLAYSRKLVVRAVCAILTVLLVYLLFQTRARTSLLSLVLFLALALPISVKDHARIGSAVVFLFVVLPIVTVFAYLAALDSGFISVFSPLASEAKTSTSRQGIWALALETVQQHPVFGSYNQIGGGTGSSQMHNTILDVWASYGTVVMVLLLAFLVKITTDVSSRCGSKWQTIAMAAALSSMATGIGEAALFSGGLGIHLLTGILLLLARSPQVVAAREP